MSGEELGELIEQLADTNPYIHNPAKARLLKLGIRGAAVALIDTVENEESPGHTKASCLMLLEKMKVQNYSELRFLIDAAREAKREGKSARFNLYMKCYLGWAEDLRKRRDEYVSRKFPKPAGKKADLVKTGKIRRLSA